MSVALASPDEADHLRPPGLRRSLSQPSFSPHQFSYPPHFCRDTTNIYSNSVSDSVADSVADSTDSVASNLASVRLSCSSIASSDTSLTSTCDDDDDDVISTYSTLPDQFFLRHRFPETPDIGPFDDTETSYDFRDEATQTVFLAANHLNTTASYPDSSFIDRAEDDSAVKSQPSRHVDYLSHEWKEEDIWSSWRYVIARRGEIANSARLENASWRSWIKAKNRLKTVSPDTLNWLKDCDMTWLYGPLQEANTALFSTDQESNSSVLSRANSFIDKKPILKKRSVSEIMLQRSLSSSSLLKQATAAVQAQESSGRRLSRPRITEVPELYSRFSFVSRRESYESSSVATSSLSSGAISPSCERKHIHFNEQVEQCIAVEVKGEDYSEMDRFDDGSDSSDGAIMMKRTKIKKSTSLFRRSTRRRHQSCDAKIIAKLPCTTLKPLEESYEHPDTAMKHSTGMFRSPALSPSSSQETLRPDNQCGRFELDHDSDANPDNVGLNLATDWDDMPNFSGPLLGPNLRRSSGSLSEEPVGMRRTPSGMFMPYEDGQQEPNDGFFGRVIDTVNTARDIAHVIWNVGWRQ